MKIVFAFLLKTRQLNKRLLFLLRVESFSERVRSTGKQKGSHLNTHVTQMRNVPNERYANDVYLVPFRGKGTVSE